MKKIILTVAAVFALTFANAQDKKEGGAGLASGDIVLSADANYTSISTGDAKGSTFGLAPGVGYMMSDNLMLLGSIGISSGTADTAGEDLKLNGLGLNAGVRYFFTPADKFSFSIGGQLGYSSVSSNLDYFDVTNSGAPVLLSDSVKTTTISLNVPLGLHYFMNDNFAITATWGGLGYSTSKDDDDSNANGKESTNTLGLNLNMSAINFGLIYKL
jgi:hypothetical protein